MKYANKTFGISVLLIFTLAFQVDAQKVDKLFLEAEELFYEERLEEALLGYQQVLQANPSYEDADYKAEICSLLTNYREKSLNEILAFGQTKGKKDKFYHYWMGRIYVRKYMYEEAIESWKVFLKLPQFHSREITKESKLFLKDGREKLAFFENTDNYEIHQLDGGINTSGAELSPAYSEETGELLFVSSRSAESEDYQIYYSKSNNRNWSEITKVDALGSFKRQHANIEVVNEDGKLFLFSPKKGGDIYFSEPSGDQWTAPQEFDSKITSTHLESHFFINEHEDRIIFATKTKKNGTDLYQSYRDAQSGKWSKPAPFAEAINSLDDEDSPYLSPDEKTLYFSSTGHNSIGGYDVFKSTFDTVKLQWTKPQNLGFPINTPDDEIHFKMNSNNNSGYFSSNRLHTKGDYDIYFFWEIQKVNIEGRIFDATAKAPITDARIRFTPSQYTDEHFQSELTASGGYGTEIIADEIYFVEIIRNHEVLFSEEFEIHETGGLNTTYIKDFVFNKPANYIPEVVETASNSSVSEPAKQKATVALQESNLEPEETKVALKPSRTKLVATSKKEAKKVEQVANYKLGRKLMSENIYFGFGTASLLRTNVPIMEKVKNQLKANPSLKIEIGGHTDNVGTSTSNLWVSQKRAEAVKKWLVEAGVSENRLIAKGYGETQPIASNDDEQNGRELNRRIEIRVIN